MGLDIKDFYLNTGLPRYEYARIHLSQLPKEIIKPYNHKDIAVNGYVYAKVHKGMYGLPQAGKVTSNELIPHLAKHGYHQSKHTPGLFKHETRPIAFALVVDDFGVKYVGKEHAEHLRDILCSKYKITEDWEGTTFCGLKLKWNYNKRYVDISMPDYIIDALQQFEHKQTRIEHAPHKWQNNNNLPAGKPCTDKEKKRILQVVGKFLYYTRAVNNTMLSALSSIAANHSIGTEETMDSITRLLNYAATHPDAVIRFTASEMVLHIHADASYLSEPKSKSRVANYFYLSDHPAMTKPEDNPPRSPPRCHQRHQTCRLLLFRGRSRSALDYLDK